MAQMRLDTLIAFPDGRVLRLGEMRAETARSWPSYTGGTATGRARWPTYMSGPWN
jgi:hypothetical protein